MFNRYFNIILILFLLCSLDAFAHKDRWDYDKSDWSKLIFATYNGKYSQMKKLINKGVDINYQTKLGLTALSVAIRKQDTIAVNILFNTGKIIKLESQNLVLLACNYPSVWIVKKLISNNYPIENTKGNYTPLMAACSFGSSEVVDYLIKIGVEVNTQQKIDNMTALMFAVFDGKIDIIKILLKSGADKNILDKNGKKAIDYIYNVPETTKKEIIKLLK